MKLQQSTFEILKNFSTINNQVVFREGSVLRIIDTDRTIFAQARVDDVFPRDFGIHDLPSLLSTMSLFPEASISYEDDHLEFVEGRRKSRYYYANIRHIKGAPTGDLKLPTPMMKFNLERKDLVDLLKASSVMKIEQLFITGSKIICKNSDGIGNDYELTIDPIDVNPEVDLDKINIDIDINIMKMIPSNYTVSVTDKAILFESTERELKYVIMLNG